MSRLRCPRYLADCSTASFICLNFDTFDTGGSVVPAALSAIPRLPFVQVAGGHHTRRQLEAWGLWSGVCVLCLSKATASVRVEFITFVYGFRRLLANVGTVQLLQPFPSEKKMRSAHKNKKQKLSRPNFVPQIYGGKFQSGIKRAGHLLRFLLHSVACG